MSLFFERLVALAISFHVVVGCSFIQTEAAPGGTTRPTTHDSKVFRCATITLSRRLETDPAGPHRAMDLQGTQLECLLSFFPHVGEGRHSEVHRGWIAGAEIILTRTDGSTIRVVTDTKFRWWNENQGDWELKPDFVKFLRETFPRVRIPTRASEMEEGRKTDQD